jgi:hypothetical protein
VEFDAGLISDEVIAVEGRFGFQLPPDLREFLQTALPRGPEFRVSRGLLMRALAVSRFSRSVIFKNSLASIPSPH